MFFTREKEPEFSIGKDEPNSVMPHTPMRISCGFIVFFDGVVAIDKISTIEANTEERHSGMLKEGYLSEITSSNGKTWYAKETWQDVIALIEHDKRCKSTYMGPM